MHAGISDTAAGFLAAALESNKNVAKLNLETNNISPQTMAKIFEAINVHQVWRMVGGGENRS